MFDELPLFAAAAGLTAAGADRTVDLAKVVVAAIVPDAAAAAPVIVAHRRLVHEISFTG